MRSRATMGLDPGIRTGVKVAIVDGTGKLLDTSTVYPFPPKNDVRGTQAELALLIRKHNVELIAIGNGTGSRETEKLVADLLAQILSFRFRCKAHQGHRLGSGRIRLFRFGAGGSGVPQSRRFVARRRLHCPPSSGSAGGTGEDRTEIHRCRPVPA